jgi:hypothetical protein
MDQALSLLEADPLTLEATEAIAAAAPDANDAQVRRAFVAIATVTTTAELWSRVGLLRATRLMVRTFS